MNTLRSFSLFESLNDLQIETFSELCQWRDYAAGEMIIDHKDESFDVRFISRGEVRVVVRMVEGREVIFNDFGADSFFGELSAIDGKFRSANVTALTNCRICIMPQSVFKQVCLDAPETGWVVMQQLVKLVRNLSDRLSDFTFLQAKQRICAELLRSSKPRVGQDDERIISPPPIQRDIADKVSSRREVVSREMKALERAGILEKAKGGLIIKKVEELRMRAGEISG